MSHRISPAIHISCSHRLSPYLYPLLFITALVSFSSWYMVRVLVPSFTSAPELNAMFWPAAFFQGPKKTLSNMVPLTNVFYLFTINNVDVKHASGVMPHIHTHILWREKQGGTLNLTFTEVRAPDHCSKSYILLLHE